jgi:hypothetical protein
VDSETQDLVRRIRQGGPERCLEVLRSLLGASGSVPLPLEGDWLVDGRVEIATSGERGSSRFPGERAARALRGTWALGCTVAGGGLHAALTIVGGERQEHFRRTPFGRQLEGAVVTPAVLSVRWSTSPSEVVERVAEARARGSHRRCSGNHRGLGTDACPAGLHHHHDGRGDCPATPEGLDGTPRLGSIHRLDASEWSERYRGNPFDWP